MGDAERESRRKRLQSIMQTRKLERQDVADLLGVSIHTVHAWLKPETSKGSNVVPTWSIELLRYKLLFGALPDELDVDPKQ
ncbi:hypothetical protein PQJ75_00790 [Rhodoplanes sp. TEM]|uniref:HTH cro/C1-type domain-containing protein n=1 Tax=Rhodoplanes tepidamans TaxID=200616 RepID=A0ABT5J664_RHOTP|nr:MULTISPECIES: hypothetical protein [Rhodoplanes]MDC7784789.1 hypothetical protein [Rhodoplanes tepidamans]MDC7982256.1 hypothetical protein [Rhodoplanes sp. TEM]MDQ0356263.1 transposase [Rhodoplanes tepidamans]